MGGASTTLRAPSGEGSWGHSTGGALQVAAAPRLRCLFHCRCLLLTVTTPLHEKVWSWWGTPAWHVSDSACPKWHRVALAISDWLQLMPTSVWIAPSHRVCIDAAWLWDYALSHDYSMTHGRGIRVTLDAIDLRAEGARLCKGRSVANPSSSSSSSSGRLVLGCQMSSRTRI